MILITCVTFAIGIGFLVAIPLPNGCFDSFDCHHTGHHFHQSVGGLPDAGILSW